MTAIYCLWLVRTSNPAKILESFRRKLGIPDAYDHVAIDDLLYRYN
jgi:hypothetical protein